MASIPNITFIEGNLVSLQKYPVFLLKRFFSMMFPLVRDIFTDGWHDGFGDGERSVTCLPSESGKLIALRFDPFGRCLFDVLDGGTDSDDASQFKEDVNVVFDRVDEHGRATDVLQHGRHVSMKGIANVIGDDSLAVFCTENEMDVEAREGLWHGFGRPFRALDFILYVNPGRCPRLA